MTEEKRHRVMTAEEMVLAGIKAKVKSVVLYFIH